MVQNQADPAPQVAVLSPHPWVRVTPPRGQPSWNGVVGVARIYISEVRQHIHGVGPPARSGVSSLTIAVP